jgi:hypothetical protein
MTERKRHIIKTALVYMLANVDDINEAFAPQNEDERLRIEAFVEDNGDAAKVAPFKDTEVAEMLAQFLNQYRDLENASADALFLLKSEMKTLELSGLAEQFQEAYDPLNDAYEALNTELDSTRAHQCVG